MDITQEQREKIEKIISEMKCPKDFICYKTGFNDLCEIQDIGMINYAMCLETNHKCCLSSTSLGYETFCHCPLRIYIAKELKK